MLNPLFTATACCLVFGVLVAAGSGHIRHIDNLVKDLRQHRVWHHHERAVAVSLTTVEIVLGAGGLIAFFLIRRDVAARWLVVAAFLYVAFAAYALFLVLRRSGVPCGCSHAGDQPANGVTVVRALVMSGLSCAAAVMTWTSGTTVSPRESLVAILAASTFGYLLWNWNALSHGWSAPPTLTHGG